MINVRLSSIHNRNFIRAFLQINSSYNRRFPLIIPTTIFTIRKFLVHIAVHVRMSGFNRRVFIEWGIH